MALPDLPGYERLRGDSARRVVDTSTGEILSRREYENRRFEAAGWESWRDYQNRAKDPAYMRWSLEAASEQKKTVRDIRHSDSEFNRLFLQARDAKFDRTAKGKNPRGPFAKLLVYAGLRQEGETRDVGDSAPRKRR